MRHLKALGAMLAIAALVAGFPAAMLGMGLQPWPTGPLPDADALWGTLLRPDDGTVLLGVLALVGWVAWVMWTTSVVLEVAGRVRGVRVPRIRGLGWSQTLAAGLVGAALLTATTPAHPATAAQPAPVTASAVAAPARAAAAAPARVAVVTVDEPAPSTRPVTADRTHRVVPGDTLWGLAETYLGAGERWREIAELNVDRAQPDGRTLAWDGMLLPGWTLHLPSPGTEHHQPAGTILVRAGDTLSELAQTHLGDMHRWPEIYQASRAIIQPGGVRLSDPDLIDIGWTLRLPPSPAAESTTQVAPSQGRASEPVAEPSPAPAPPAATVDGPQRAASTPTPIDDDAALLPQAKTEAAGTRAATDAATQSPGSAPAAQTAAPPAHEDAAWPVWALAGLTGAGALLSGAALLMLHRRRRSQFRHRRPGRAVAAPAPSLAPVEQTLIAVGAATSSDVTRLHEALRSLGHALTLTGQPLPPLRAVQLDATALHLHLTQPGEPPTPWTADPAGTRWTLPHTLDIDTVDPAAPAPYPLLTPIGQDTDGVWLANLEGQALSITGDTTMAEDLVRFIATGLAVYPWADGIQVDCYGIAEEIAHSTCERLQVGEPGTVNEAVADAVALIDRATAEHVTTLPSGRAAQTGLDTWPAQVLLINQTSPAADTDATAQLLGLIAAHPSTVGTAVLIRTDQAAEQSAALHVTTDGRLHALGRDLEAVGLTPDETTGIGLLLDQAASITDAPMPTPDADGGWQSFTDRAGALRPELTEPRGPAAGGNNSLLPAADTTYLATAATTVDDLHTLAPTVPDSIAADVLAADPTLEADLHEWRHGGARPKLRLLGPVEVRATGTTPAKRRPYYTDLLAFLNSRERGATRDDVARYFAANRVPHDVGVLRKWLGRDADGTPWLPDGRDTGGRYRVPDLLTDADLFTRLRARGQARGADGLPDLLTALSLVRGEPYTQLRAGGWAWLGAGQRYDEYARCAIVDTAHVVVTATLATGDLAAARTAAETAALAAPESEATAADLAAVAAAEGRHTDIDRHLNHVANYAEPGEAPEDASTRGQRLLTHGPWIEQAS